MMTEDTPRIGPPRRVVMRLPDTDSGKDLWTGAAQPSEGELDDEAALAENASIDENVPLMPPLGRTPAEVQAEWSEYPILEQVLAEQRRIEAERPLQFTIGELLMLMTMAAIGLAGLRWFPPVWMSLTMGAMTVGFLWATTRYEIRNRAVHVAGWSMLSIYFVSLIAAIARTTSGG